MTRLTKLICLILACLFLLAGCVARDNGGNNRKTTYKHTGNEVLAPVEISYVVENPVEIQFIEKSENTYAYRCYFKISGLKDKSVENKINNEIKELFDRLCRYADGEDRPPFRGIMQLPDDKYIPSEYSFVSVSPEFNYNNVLSVQGYCHFSINSDGANKYNFSYQDSLNYDLSTGKTFRIADIFANNATDFSIINNRVLKEIDKMRLKADRYPGRIEGNDAGSFLIAPFKGITNDQKFYINEMGIYIIINENNPEFDINYYCLTLHVPFIDLSTVNALTRRFVNKDNSIYEKQPYKKCFLRFFPSNDEIKRSEFTNDGTTWYKTFYIDKSMPQKLKDIANQAYEDKENKVKKLVDEYNCDTAHQSFEAKRVGTYMEIGSSYRLTYGDKSISSSEFSLYDKEGRKIELGDLFIEGFDYEKLIRDRIRKELENISSGEKANIDEIYNDLSFSLYNTNIHFTTGAFKIDLTEILFDFYMDYEEIGYDNLTIFKD